MYSPELPLEKRPRITRLYFEFSCDASSAPEHQRVVNVRSLGSTGGAVIECSPDLARRANGFENMLRIYARGSTVKLNVSSLVGGAAFDAWDLLGNQINRVEVKQTYVEIKLDDNVLAQCHWRRAQVEEAEVVLSHKISAKAAAQIAASHPETSARRMKAASVSVEEKPRDLPIRIEASEQAAIVGVAPAIDDADLVEEGKEGWKMVNYRGVVGWIRA